MNTVEVSPLMGGFFSLMFFSGLFLDFLFVARRGRIPHALNEIKVAWGWLDFLIVVLFFLIFGEGLGFIARFFLNHFEGFKRNHSLVLCFLSMLAETVSVVFLIRFLKIRYGTSLRKLGFVQPIRFKSIGVGAMYYVSAVPVIILVGVVTKSLAELFKIPLEPQAPLKMLMQESSIKHFLIMAFLIVAVAPFLEEIFFRGFLYPLIRKFLGWKSAIFFSALVFASLHFSVLAFLPITCIGCFLAYLYEKTGSLTASITFHVINNLITVLIVSFILK